MSDPDNLETSRIEQIQCRDNYEDRELDYSNMLVCCPVFINREEHCDKSKHNYDLTFNPFDLNLELSISYSTKNGEIKSNNNLWNNDINNILKLNNALLKANRYQAFEGCSASVTKKKMEKGWDK